MVPVLLDDGFLQLDSSDELNFRILGYCLFHRLLVPGINVQDIGNTESLLDLGKEIILNQFNFIV